MYFEHETITDDALTQLYFTPVIADNQLLPAHWHNHMEILYIVKGTLTANINEASYQLTLGDLLIINPKDIHYTHAHTDCHYYLLQIPAIHLARMSSDWQLLHFLEYIPSSAQTNTLHEKLSTVIDELIRINRNQEKGYQLLFLIQIYQFLYLIYTNASTQINEQNKSRNERDFKRIEESMQFVKKNYSRQFALSEVASSLSLSTEYFCRLFKKYTGQSFFTYVNQICLLRFYQDLLHTQESINFLMDKNGIVNYKGFMKMFKEAYGTTPHRLRMRYRDSLL